MKKTIGYIRVSTTEQSQNGVSLANQLRKIEAFGIAKDTELCEVIEDAGYSAKSLNRPGMIRLIEMVRENQVSTVVIYKLDRITRSVKDLGTLIDLFNRFNVDLMSVQDSIDTSTAAGRLVLNVMASVSQWERETIAERTSEALQYKKASGKIYGEIPYGFLRVGDDLIEDENEQRVITLMQSLKDQGYSYRAIARELENDGILTKKGNTRWSHKTVKKIISNAA